MSLIQNASPQAILLGADDKSRGVVTAGSDPIPLHLPLFYIHARKGPTDRVVLGSSKFMSMFGDETFNKNDKYFNHQTLGLQLAGGNANTCMVQRVVPEDAGVRSNIVVYMDILEDEIPNYKRNSDGSYVVNKTSGEYEVETNPATISGYRVKYITEHLDAEAVPGLLQPKEGTMLKVTKDNTKLREAIRLEHYNIALTLAKTPDATFDIDTKMKKFVTDYTAFDSAQLDAKITAAKTAIGNLDGDPTKAPPSSYEPKDVGNPSRMYPIFEVKAKYQGEYYNNIGFAITNLFKDEVDSKVLAKTKSLPFKLALYTRANDKSSPEVMRSLYGEPSVLFSFKEKIINPNTDARFDLEFVFNNNWFNETDSLKPLKYRDYDKFYFYRDNYETITNDILAKEKAHVSATEKTWADSKKAATLTWFDFTTDDATAILEENFIVNPFSLKSSKGVNYFTVIKGTKATLTDKQTEVNINRDSPIMLKGGKDGTISNENFEKAVVKAMDAYVDADSEVQDLAINVENHFYDTGFTLETKKQLAKFITMRKDTFLVYSTHDASLGEKDLPLSEARAVAVALRTRLELAPESDYFGTSVARSMIMAGTMLLRDGSVSDRVPYTLWLLNKASKLGGSSSGKWQTDMMFDQHPMNVMDIGVDCSPKFIPGGIKPTLWNDGIVWAQPLDRLSYFFPGLQTVYKDDTSALNNYFAALVVAWTARCGFEVWTEMTGSSGKSDSMFLNEANNKALNKIQGKFGSKFVIIPKTFMDPDDKARGYSYKQVFEVYSPVMKTVATIHSSVYRIEDLNK